ncbi:MAG: DUF2190 domain-containing protein [Oleiphilus sp.]|nr:MAG: DUF2190 domain-containing protein [Oleiphilus sp.]
MPKTHIPVCPITVTANGVLIANRFVGADKAQAGAGANTLGVAMHPAEDGDDATIETLGVVSVETGASVTIDSLVESDASGRAVDQSAGEAVGRALDGSAAAGEFVRVLLIRN